MGTIDLPPPIDPRKNKTPDEIRRLQEQQWQKNRDNQDKNDAK